MPTPKNVHIDRALTNISVAYIQEASRFIADKVFPVIPVMKQSDTYFTYSRDDFFRDEAGVRAPGAESAGGDYDVTTADPYYCRVVAFHKDITEEERVNSDDPLNPNQDATDFVTQKLLIRRENDWASKYFGPGKWGTDISGVTSGAGANQVLKWSKPESDPIGDIKRAKTQMLQNTGYEPNTLVLSVKVFDALCEHEDIIDRIKYTQRGVVTEDLLAQLFGVERIFVTKAIVNTANKGVAGKNQFIMPDGALLMYVEMNPGLRKPSAGYIFAWKGLKGAGAYGNRVVRFNVPHLGIETERVEGEMAYDAKQIAADLGTFFKDVL